MTVAQMLELEVGEPERVVLSADLFTVLARERGGVPPGSLITFRGVPLEWDACVPPRHIRVFDQHLKSRDIAMTEAQ